MGRKIEEKYSLPFCIAMNDKTFDFDGIVLTTNDYLANNITPNQKQCLEEIMKVFISFCMDDKQLNTTSDEDVCKKILMGNNN